MRTASSAGCILRGARERCAWFSVHYLSWSPRRRGSAFHRTEEMDDKEERRKDENANEDKVTLKKEIGLMSACAIIIGECVAVSVIYDVCELADVDFKQAEPVNGPRCFVKSFFFIFTTL